MPRGRRGGLKPGTPGGSPWQRGAYLVRRGLATRHARDIGGLWGAEAFSLVITLAQAMFVARILGPRSYGIAALVIAVPSFVFSFLDPQSEAAVVRYVTRFERAGDPDRSAAVVKTAYVADLGLALAGSLVVAVAATWMSRHLVHDPKTSYLVILAALGLSTAAPAATSRAVLSTFGGFAHISRLSIVAALVRNGLTVGFVAFGLGIRGVVFGAVLGQIVESVILFVASQRVLRRQTGHTWRSSSARALRPHTGEFVRFMAYTELTTLTTAVTKQADVLLLGLARGPTDVGFYRLASSIAAVAARIITPLQAVVYPDMARAAAAGDDAGLRRLVRRHFLLVGVPLAAAGAVALPLVGWVVRFSAGTAYVPAIGVTQIIIAGTLVSLCTYWLRPLYMATGRVRQFFVMTAAVTVVSVAAIAVGAHRYGAAGVATARAIGSGVLGTGVALAAIALRRGSLSGAGATNPQPPAASGAGPMWEA